MDMLSSNDQDMQAITQIAQGVGSAMEPLWEKYHAYVKGISYSILRNWSDADEVASETFARISRSAGSFRGDCTLKTYLHAIARRLCYNRYRTRRGNTLSFDDPDSGLDLAVDDTIGQNLELRDFNQIVREKIDLLQPTHREILLLAIDDVSYEGIAVILDLNVGTVKSRIARARESLREHLEHRNPSLAAKAV
jgi:RNA polymerase sigma-70 factor, ECF subfamily